MVRATRKGWLPASLPTRTGGGCVKRWKLMLKNTWERSNMTDTQWHRFEVFVQEKAGEPHQNVGAVHAPDEEIALQNAATFLCAGRIA